MANENVSVHYNVFFFSLFTCVTLFFCITIMQRLPPVENIKLIHFISRCLS